MTEAEYLGYLHDTKNLYHDRLVRATDLLREWRDKYVDIERHPIRGGASPTDLIVSTQKFLEGK